METLANPTALQLKEEDPISGAGTATTTLATGKTATTARSMPTQQEGAARDPFNLTEEQIKSSRGALSFSRVTGSFRKGEKK